MADDKFTKVVGFVIDNLEGGYYHPNMLKDGRVKDSRYSSSGETMFGIDRKAGGAINDTAAGKQFWGLIDQANAANTWHWNYKGGSLAPQLKELAAEVIAPEFQRMSQKYLTPQALALVNQDDRLLFNFVYASWNGEGWFKRFAQPFNNAVAAGERNLDNLVKIAVQARTNSGNSLIAQGGNKIANIIDQLKGFGEEVLADPIGTAKKKPAIVIVSVSMITISIIFAIWGIGKIVAAKKEQQNK